MKFVSLNLEYELKKKLFTPNDYLEEIENECRI